MDSISKEDLKKIVCQILDKDKTKTFNSVIDIATFLWEVVEKIIEISKDKELTLQQKEDLAVKNAGIVVDFLEEKSVITVELAIKVRSLIKTADVFLDILIGIYSFVEIKKTMSNPTPQNCFKAMFSVLSCISNKSVKTDTSKVIVLAEEKSVNTCLKIEDVKIIETDKTDFEYTS
jgi:hypothetical protein